MIPSAFGSSRRFPPRFSLSFYRATVANIFLSHDKLGGKSSPRTSFLLRTHVVGKNHDCCKNTQLRGTTHHYFIVAGVRELATELPFWHDDPLSHLLENSPEKAQCESEYLSKQKTRMSSPTVLERVRARHIWRGRKRLL